MQINFRSITPKNNIIQPAFKHRIPSFGNSDNYQRTPDYLDNYYYEELANVIRNSRHEKNIERYIKMLSDKKCKSSLNYFKNRKIEDLSHIVIIKDSGEREYINNIFRSAGIKSILQFNSFINALGKNSAIFKGQYIEAVKIYGYLKNKSDFNSYPEFLLQLFNQEENENNPDYDKLNAYTGILKKSGVSNESEFDEKLSYLKPEFNNFESEDDKINAVKYLSETYNSKIELLGSILKSNPNTSKREPEQAYYELSSAVNYLYLKNDGKNLGKLSDYIDVIFDLRKIKYSAKNQLKQYFGNIDYPENKIALAEVLKKYNVSADDISLYTNKTFVSDSDLLNVIKNKEDICSQIHTQNPEKLFNNFYDILTAVYTKGGNKKDTEALDNLLSVINDYEIKTQNSFLTFYNNVCNTKEKSLTTEQISEFADLFRYSDIKGITDYNVLKQNKENYYKALPYIENFLKNDANDYLIGKSPLEIYREFGYCTDFSSYESIKALNDIAVFHQANTEETQKRQEDFGKFKQYFESKQETVDFLLKNEISFDDTEESGKYKNGCLEILDILSGNPDKLRERIDKLTETGILPESKYNLDSFLNKYKNTGQLNQLIEIIADKEIPSVKILEDFFSRFENSSGEHDNLIKHLSGIPDDMDFISYTEILESLNNCIKQYQIPRSIDNDNILNIDINKYKNKKINGVKEVNDLLSSILNIKGSNNFINGLKSTYTHKKQIYNPYKIAEEIVKNLGKTDESYQNIARELKLDKESLKLPPDYDDILYLYAVKNKLPAEFTDFVNSNDWLNFLDDENKIPNLTLHARLRLIDRTVLNEQDSIEKLYQDTAKERLKTIIKSIYTQTPSSLRGRDETHRITILTPFENKRIESVFSNRGELITAILLN